ncbi:isoprenoid biosynthesis glyoxalase ElbB [Aliivibrio sifiae]|uniref:Glyoxalase n=1 Tax=Aliivibrio sifiae TaxID=566293 RepID=A0A2S7X197_9GAMM|nr:isoprenoid biosynthesis glyoxalase ElbB [Aliivibrio sifiae]PQJ83528.1 isoprenoid biosynthesis protein ElbB [Aliivibrio sifiae]GLR76840.1 glyoxalase [Aliivibrio sifiae]
MKKNIAIILSGCGYLDGAEINESVLTMLALEEANISYNIFSLNKNQHHVVNHQTGDEEQGVRNILVESARIARGNIQDIKELEVKEFDGIIVIGGFGVAKNLSNFAILGEKYSIDDDIEKVLSQFKEQQKASAYMCISPVLLPKIYDKPTCTIGNDADTASIIENLGGQHIEVQSDQVCIDQKNKIITTPAYMLCGSILEARKGISKLVSEFKQML